MTTFHKSYDVLVAGGEVVGVAAAMAVRSSIAPDRLDANHVRGRLQTLGFVLHRD
ncbi:MAG: hypothetical protein JXQ73_07450 [Phycisphaerae bacterium]|nr:hypothetical protein [Phycisphaerae bacterium]